MRKLFLGAMVCASIMLFTSCEDTKMCYEVSYKLGDVTMVAYIYASANEIDSLIEAEGIPGGFTKRVVPKSEADCVGGGIEF